MHTRMVIVMVSKIAGIAPIGAVTFFQENDRTYGDMMKRRKQCGFQSALQKALHKEAQQGEAREEAYRINLPNPLR